MGLGRSTKGWALVVVGAMGVIVALFVISTLVIRAATVSTAQALSVATNGGPSVRLLATARTHLRLQREAAAAYVFRAGGESAKNEMAEAGRRVRATFAEEQRTPSYPDEQVLEQRVVTALAELNRSTVFLRPSRTVSESREGFLPFQAAVDRVDESLAQLEEHNAQYLQLDAERVLAKQSTATWLVLGLDAMNTLLAVLVSILLIVFLRRYFALLAVRNHELEMFSSRVAHDLTSPLATVGIALDLVASKANEQLATKTVRSARVALKRVRAIMDALLDFARSGGKPNLEARAVVGEVLEGVLDDAHVMAESASVEVILKPFDPCSVACSAGVLSVMASNLVGNAIKFMGKSANRCIEIQVKPSSTTVRIDVIDSGEGFPAGLETTLFEPYFRASTNLPGLGLGLATVKRLAEAHGGRAGVERLTVGSCFWFELPAAIPSGRGSLA
jgi:signal transduction histidine kinase